MASEERPLRFCDICLQVDDHPRHLVGLPAGATAGRPPDEVLEGLDLGQATIFAVDLLLQPNLLSHHHDCGAANGCEVCQVTEEVNGERRGQELIDHLAAERGEG